MVLMDLSKAFDTVDHFILCQKLKLMGVESIDWFLSYLSDRFQVTHVGGCLSESMKVTHGVPQGSILGPLLFLCYINDMHVSLNKDFKLLIYADNSAILFPHVCPKVISQRLGEAVESCKD